MRYVCPICGYVYDEAKEGKAFADLPETWVCPLCGAAKSAFTQENQNQAPKPASPTIQVDEDMKKLSAGELAALCSNLARGCEKQYKTKESELFREIADYFSAAAPALTDPSIERLAALIQNDLREGYPELRSAAVSDSDRGTQRICVWGEKVTNILNTLLQRWEREGDSFLQDTQVWVCTVCGFIYIGDAAPALCPVCKVPAWKFEKIEGRAMA